MENKEVIGMTGKYLGFVRVVGNLKSLKWSLWSLKTTEHTIIITCYTRHRVKYEYGSIVQGNFKAIQAELHKTDETDAPDLASAFHHIDWYKKMRALFPRV